MYKNASHFGLTTYKIAAVNRISVKGPPVFYAAYDERTVFSEIHDPTKSIPL